MKDFYEERSALKGAAICKQAMGQHQDALDLLMKVVAINLDLGEIGSDADTYGRIADLHAELGDMSEAAHWYDRCLEAINRT